jgi:hypothetical protein
LRQPADEPSDQIAAHALERAAEAASAIRANNSDVDVWAALEALRDLLGTVNGEKAAW